MADWGISRFGGAFVSPAWGVAMTANISVNTKGAYTEFYSATTRTGYLSVEFVAASLNYAYLTDVAIGAAGSEFIIASNLLFEWSSSYGIAFSQIEIPIIIPAGTRVSARTQCSTSGGQVLIGGIFIHTPGGFYNSDPYAIMTTYGANTSDSGGTSVDPGAAANTWGPYIEFTASCERPIKGIVIGATAGLNQSRSDLYHFIYVGMGPQGSEISIAGQSMRSHNSTNYVTPLFSNCFPVQIPAGTRLSVRAYCNGNDANDRLTDIVLYCFS